MLPSAGPHRRLEGVSLCSSACKSGERSQKRFNVPKSLIPPPPCVEEIDKSPEQRNTVNNDRTWNGVLTPVPRLRSVAG
jgi:hypothetical protein